MINFVLTLILSLFVSVNTSNSIPTDVYNKAVYAWHVRYSEDHNLSPYLTIVDFTKPSSERRFWVVDLRSRQIIYSGYVAHGIGSGTGQYVLSVSNQIGSKKSSIGTFITKNTYYGHNGYSLRIVGLELGINSNVFVRNIVVHGSEYVNSRYVGHSWGCFALDSASSTYVINLIKNNSLIFVYYPDQHWLKTSRFIKHG